MVKGRRFRLLHRWASSRFCGVLQCLSPEPNQIIVPDWTMRSMFGRVRIVCAADSIKLLG